MSKLRIAGCSFEAAKFAVMNWHYSKTMPAGKLVKFGVWENDKFIGAVIFGRGANGNLGKPYGLTQTETCELVRVALKSHLSPVTKIVAICLRELSKTGLRLVVSFADTEQRHVGTIYQAGNWVYTGLAGKAGGVSIKVNGKWIHKRTLGALYGRRDKAFLDEHFPNAERRGDTAKYRYVYPLDAEMRKQIEPLAKPYPKRVTSIDSDAAAFQVAEGGANPTVTLQN